MLTSFTLRASITLVLAAAGLALPGCGSDEAPPTSARQAADQPLQGKAASSASQFEGSWLCITHGPLAALEFTRDDKVLTYRSLESALAGQGGMMLTYAVLDGGRLSLTSPDGRTQTFDAVLTRDEMQLQTQAGETHRYQKVKAGSTLAQAVTEFVKERFEAYQKRAALLREHLAQPNLLLVVQNDAGQETMATALALQPGNPNTFHGSAVNDLALVTVAPAELKLVLNERSFDTKVQVALRPAQTVTGQAAPGIAQGSFMMNVDDSPNGLVISGPIRVGDQSFQAKLLTDPIRHAGIMASYQKERDRIDALKQPMVEALSDFAILRGSAGVANSEQTTTDQITLVRNAGDGPVTWRGEIETVNDTTGQSRTLPFAAAGVGVENDKAVLVIPANGRIYQLTLQGQFTGKWSANPNTPGQNVTLDIIQATDKATHDAQVEAQRQALLAISQDQVFHGFVPVNGPSKETAPATLRMQISPDGNISAQVHYTLFKSNVLMQGQIEDALLGPTISLKFQDIPSGQEGVRLSANMLSMKIRNQRWNLRLTDTGPVTRLTGHLSIAGQGSMQFVEATDTWKAHHQALIKNALQQGATFTVIQPDRKNVEPTLIDLKLADDGQAVTGTLTQGGRHLAVKPESTLEGKLADIGPWPGVSLTLAPFGVKSTRHTLELIVLERQGKLILSGVMFPNHAPQAENYIELEKVTQD